MGVTIDERPDGVAVVRLGWPEKRNALGPDDTREVGDAIASAAASATSGVVVTGDGAFCAGGDLEQFARLSAGSSASEVRVRIYENVHSVLRSIRSSPVPVAAAVDGAAVGLGFDYAVACDMCFVGSKGWLQQGWAMAGLIHGAGGSGFIQRASGAAFWRLVDEQSRLDGPAVEELGLGEAVEGSAVEAALGRLVRLGHLPGEVLKAYVELFRAERWPEDEFFDRCATHQAEFIASDAFRARADAILAERARS